MAYVGNPVDTQNTFQSLQGKRFSGDGSTTAFTLDVAPGNVLDIEVFVGNVRQDPNSAYTLSGTTLTFTGAPPSGTNNIYVVHQAKSVGTIDVPALGVSTASIQADAITEAKIADDAVESEHLNNNIISGQTELASAPDSTDELLISDGGTLKRIDVSLVGGTNTPAFFATASGNQTGLSDNTYTKVTLANEVYDTDSAFADSRFTVPSGEAGKYIFYGSVRPDADSNSDLKNAYMAFYLNGSRYSENRMNFQSNLIRGSTNVHTISLDLSASDYVELYGATDTDGSARSIVGGSSNNSTFMGGYKLVT